MPPQSVMGKANFPQELLKIPRPSIPKNGQDTPIKEAHTRHRLAKEEFKQFLTNFVSRLTMLDFGAGFKGINPKKGIESEHQSRRHGSSRLSDSNVSLNLRLKRWRSASRILSGSSVCSSAIKPNCIIKNFSQKS